MTRKLLFLNGLAAIMVVLNHSASYGLNALFFWTDRYLPVSVPNFDQYGSLTYYILFFIHEVAEFAIPAFLFVSGFFIAFAARTGSGRIRWNFIYTRIKKLIFPFAIWSIIVIVVLQRFPPTLRQILTAYYYIPLIIQYYLLSPILIPLAKKRWKLLLVLAAIIQFGLESLRLLALLGVDFPGINLIIQLSPIWFFPGRIFYFSIGLVAGLQIDRFGTWLTRSRWILISAAVILFTFSLFEYEYLVSLLEDKWIIPKYSGLFRGLYAVTFTLSILAFDKIPIPFPKKISSLGEKSLGIYFANMPLIYVVASLMYFLIPTILGFPLIYQAILITSGLGGTLLLMWIVLRSPVRKAYPYIFG
jgi:membrane-bound acyltransferase YfiQ involved in biofilm formation